MTIDWATIDWTIIASVIGMLTGITGAITGILSTTKVNKLKALDLRLDAGQKINNIDIQIKTLPKKSKDAKTSKERCFAAQGQFQSGAMQKWQAALQSINEDIKTAEKTFSCLKKKDLNNKTKKLEQIVLELDLLEKTIRLLTEQLDNFLLEDKESVNRLKNERLQRDTARLASCVTTIPNNK